MQVCIAEALDRLPEAYTKELYDQKCDAVYQHVFEAYQGEGRSLYVTA